MISINNALNSVVQHAPQIGAATGAIVAVADLCLNSSAFASSIVGVNIAQATLLTQVGAVIIPVVIGALLGLVIQDALMQKEGKMPTCAQLLYSELIKGIQEGGLTFEDSKKMLSDVAEEFPTSPAEKNMPALHQAVHLGAIDYVRAISNAYGLKEADLEAVHKGRTPLYVAAEYRRVEVVKALIDAGAKKGNTVEFFVKGQLSALDVILKNKGYLSKEHQKAQEQYKAIQTLLQD